MFTFILSLSSVSRTEFVFVCKIIRSCASLFTLLLKFQVFLFTYTVCCVRIPRNVWEAPLRPPTPLQSILCPIIDPILVTFGQICNFRDPNLVTFYLCIYLMLNEERFTFHLQYKLSGTFANHKCEELSYPPKKEMCDPIVVTLLKMRPHYKRSSRENATPSSGTLPLASYKEVPPPPPPPPGSTQGKFR